MIGGNSTMPFARCREVVKRVRDAGPAAAAQRRDPPRAARLPRRVSDGSSPNIRL